MEGIVCPREGGGIWFRSGKDAYDSLIKEHLAEFGDNKLSKLGAL